ncbi:DNA/RNA polymerase [Wilcoxina mikolae CBS 423.85]|nr:DNA/RNA polymerase [Wilcoxina mikolae CBS 423.85]
MVFRFKLNNIDFYRSSPTDLDPALPVVSAAEGTPPVPILRIFGATESGQRVCAHVHGVFPYLYVEYPGPYFGNDGKFNAESVQKVLCTLRRSIDFALNSSTFQNKNNVSEEKLKQQHVASIALVKGVPFYGYSAGWRLYCKIYLYNPRQITSLVKLLSSGAIMKRKLQPYEAHINYILQFMIDFNLYGCGFMECDEAKLKFRRVYGDDENSDGSDNSDDEMTGQNYDTLPEDEFPKHTYAGWEIDIRAHDILNRHEIKERSYHQDFEERKKLYDPDFKHLHSLDELWKAHGNHANQQDDAEDAWTMPSTARGGTQPEWIQEREFRTHIDLLIQQEKGKEKKYNRAKPGFESLLRKIPNEKYIPTAFQSVDYISSFGVTAGKATSTPLENNNEDIDVDMNLVKLVGEDQQGEYDLNDEDATDPDHEGLNEFDGEAIENQEQLDQSDDEAPHSPAEESDNGEGPSSLPSAKKEPDLGDYAQSPMESGKPKIPELSKVDFHSAFEIKRTKQVYYYARPAPLASEILESLQDEGIHRMVYTEPFFGNIKDVPNQTHEYGGVRRKLRSHDPIHLPVFDPTGVGNCIDDNTAVNARVWIIIHEPPSRFEVCKWAEEQGPTQKNKYGFKYSSRKNTSKSRQKSSDMSIMSLEIHVNTRGTLVPNPKEDPITCIFWCIQLGSSGESQTGIIVTDDVFTEEILRRFADVDAYVEPDEMYMINTLIDIVRDLDPDILTGYEVQSSSWGYVIERATHLNGLELCKDLARVKHHAYGRFGKDTNLYDHNKGAGIYITGRHFVNIWRAMRGELNLLGYKMENVVYHLLNRRIPHYSHKDLTVWYKSGNPGLICRVLKYYLLKVKLDLEILEKQEFVTKISEQAQLIGVDFYTVFSRGSQVKVESLMFRIAKPESYLLISPTRAQVASQNAIECKPLILEPQSNFYTSPVVVLDFQSLYPSIMIAYNYCYSTCLGRAIPWQGTNKVGVINYHRPQGLLGLCADKINVSPNGILYVKPEFRKSLLAKMLSEILDTRVMVKNRMKSDKDDKILQQKLNSWQLALKLTANVTYGYTSASFSGRMPCVEIADSIVQSGKETLEKAISLIHTEERWGAEVVYGDTDSLFVHLKGKTKDEAFDIGEEIAERVTAMNPRPIKLKFEKVYLPCVLMSMKRYVGFKYEYRDQKEPEFDAKGIETVRRDGTPATQKMQETALKILFRSSDLSEVKEYCLRQWAKIQQDKVSIQDFCIAREVKLGSYAEGAPLQPGAKIALERMEHDPRDEPQYGERIPYVVHAGDIEKKSIASRSIDVPTLLHSGHLVLDADYYIKNKIIPPLERIFKLVGADVSQWYKEMPKYRHMRRIIQDGTETRKKGITLAGWLTVDTLTCTICREKTPKGQRLCNVCRTNRDASIYQMKRRLAAVEKRTYDLQSICRSCTGASRPEEIACDSLECPVYYSRVRETAKFQYAKKEGREILEILRAV